MSLWEDDGPVALGVVVDEARGSLPYALVHGESLVAAAAWALGEAEITAVDLTTTWTNVQEVASESGRPFVLHDSLCPMTPPEFLARCVASAAEHGEVVVGVRPVTDTVKQVHDGVVGDTVDRDQLVHVCSPIVLPPSVVSELAGFDASDFPALVAALERRFTVRRLTAPAQARRVAGDDDLALVEALTEPRDQT